MTASKRTPSSFGERFAFARWWQAGTSVDETDQQFGRALGKASSGTVSAWRQRIDPPPTDICDAIALRTGVNAIWLRLGEYGIMDEPEPFASWLQAHRRGKAQEQAAAAPPDDDRPDYLRLAETHGGKVAEGSQERPGTKKPVVTKRPATARRKPKK